MIPMNTSILDRTMLRFEARRHMLTAANLAYEASISARVETLDDSMPLERWKDWHDSLNEVGRGALRQVLSELPGPEIFNAYTYADNHLSVIQLSEASDIRWAACSRGWLIDSVTALRDANFDEAYAKAELATERLFNLLSRNRPTRMLDPIAGEQIGQVLSLCDNILTALSTAMRVLA